MSAPSTSSWGCSSVRNGSATIALRRAGVSPDAVRDRLLEKLQPCEPRLDADALATLGIDLDRVRARVEEAFGPGSLKGGFNWLSQRLTSRSCDAEKKPCVGS